MDFFIYEFIIHISIRVYQGSRCPAAMLWRQWQQPGNPAALAAAVAAALTRRSQSKISQSVLRIDLRRCQTLLVPCSDK